jgi:hypothetical protein
VPSRAKREKSHSDKRTYQDLVSIILRGSRLRVSRRSQIMLKVQMDGNVEHVSDPVYRKS